MSPDVALAAVLLALIATIEWRTALVVGAVGLFVVSLGNSVGYW